MAADAHGSVVRNSAPATQPLGWFRLLYVASIIGLSVQTMIAARGLRDHHIWLAAVEIIGALMLLTPTLQRVGLSVLLAVYAVAAVITIHGGHIPIYLALYAGTAVFLVQESANDR